MSRLMLFVDGSLDPKTGVGVGAYLALQEQAGTQIELIEQVRVKQFEQTSSTALELQTLLWAIDDVVLSGSERAPCFIVYSDSQSIVNLPARRGDLEHKNYYANSGERLNNAELYQQFYGMMDRYDCQIIKVKGHKPQHEKSDLDKIFSLVDKASRSALRSLINKRADSNLLATNSAAP